MGIDIKHFESSSVYFTAEEKFYIYEIFMKSKKYEIDELYDFFGSYSDWQINYFFVEILKKLMKKMEG